MESARDKPLPKRIAAKLVGLKTNFPQADFDALKASPRLLLEHYMPPRPDPKTPIAYANWVRALASRPRFPNLEHPRPRIEQIFELGLVVTPLNRIASEESSGNWSGAIVRPRNFDSMALVQGRWIVPPTPAPRGNRSVASSAWVGLDGHDPASRIMPQIGTSQFAILQPPDATPTVGQVAWWQLWLRDHPELWQVPIPVTISPGDKVYAQVQVISGSTLSLFFKNETTNTAWPAYYDLAAEPVYAHAGPFERRTAEWIVECPLQPGPDGKPMVVALADYGGLAFTDCNAAAGAGSVQHDFQLQRARLIRMNDWNDEDHPGRLASEPEQVGDDVLVMSYVGPP